MKKIISLLLVCALAVCSFSMVSATATREGIGMSIDGFSTTDLYDNPVDSSILDEATVTIINYWATWCGPCVNEMPHFQQLHEHYSETPEADVQILGVISVGSGCTPASARAFLEQHGYTWTNMTKDSLLAAVFGTSPYIPQTIVVDRHGTVRDHRVGSFPNYTQLKNFAEEWLETLTAEEPEPEPVLVGDADGDGELTVTDAILIARISIGLIEVENIEAADYDGNGTVSIGDAILLMRNILGLEG